MQAAHQLPTSMLQRQRAAFTLVEVTMVVVVLALMTGTVALSLRGNLQAARAELAFEQVALTDRQTRELAER